MRFTLALLWGNANRITGDFAERGAVQRGHSAPLRDIVSIPPPFAVDGRHMVTARADDPDVWSTRRA